MKDSKEDKMPRDSNGKWHGHQEWYNGNNILLYRGTYKHGLDVGYEEIHTITKTKFHIK